MNDLSHYSILAGFFRYPTNNLKTDLENCLALVAPDYPGISGRLQLFIDHMNEKPLSLQQEYYTETFDVQAICFLDIGYTLFGEDYKRGLFMVNIKKEQLKANNDCGSELPDFLPNILTLLPKLADKQFAEELICTIIIPALKEMIASFRTQNNVYKGLLEVLILIMEKDFSNSEFKPFEFTTGLQKSLSTHNKDNFL